MVRLSQSSLPSNVGKKAKTSYLIKYKIAGLKMMIVLKFGIQMRKEVSQTWWEFWLVICTQIWDIGLQSSERFFLGQPV